MKEEEAMNTVTKLINCGDTVLLYESRNKRISVEVEKSKVKVENLRVSLLTNFVNEQLLAVFYLKISLSEYGNVEEKLQQFVNELKSSSGLKDIRYMAVAHPSLSKESDYAIIYLVTNIDVFALTAAMNYEILEEQEEAYFKNLWKNELSIDIYTGKQLVETFTIAYEKGLKSDILGKRPIKFRKNLKSPQILYNEEADQYMKKEEVLNYPYFKKESIFSNTTGYCTLYEYSRYNTASLEGEEEFNWYRKHCRIT